MTTPDYCCVAPSLMGLTPISRPRAQRLNLTVAIELVKHPSPSEREYCKPLGLIVPSNSCMFTFSRLTAIYRNRYTTFIISRFTIRLAQHWTFALDFTSAARGEKNNCQPVVRFTCRARLMLTLLVPCSQMWNEFCVMASELLRLNCFSFQWLCLTLVLPNNGQWNWPLLGLKQWSLYCELFPKCTNSKHIISMNEST